MHLIQHPNFALRLAIYLRFIADMMLNEYKFSLRLYLDHLQLAEFTQSLSRFMFTDKGLFTVPL